MAPQLSPNQDIITACSREHLRVVRVWGRDGKGTGAGAVNIGAVHPSATVCVGLVRGGNHGNRLRRSGCRIQERR